MILWNKAEQTDIKPLVCTEFSENININAIHQNCHWCTTADYSQDKSGEMDRYKMCMHSEEICKLKDSISSLISPQSENTLASSF